MNKEDKDKLVKELESKGYRPWKDCYRHNYYSWIKYFNKDTDKEYYIAFRHWDYTGYRETDKSLINDEHSFDIEIRYGNRVCILELNYPDVCGSTEKAESIASLLSPIIFENLNL